MIFTEDYKSEILSAVKLLAGIGDNKNDTALRFIIDDTINMVLSYCRLQILPYRLYGLIPQMVISIFNAIDCGSNNIRSIAEGDRKIEFENTKTILENYHERLLPFINYSSRMPSDLDKKTLI